ncbi:MAG: DUF2007 domain-containing protein [Polyangiales bacterium]
MPFRESSPPPPPSELVNPVLLRTFLSAHEAEFAAAKLEADGIASRVEGGATAGVHPWLASAMGGVRLVVDAADEDRAREVLDALAPKDDDEQDALAKSTEAADAEARRALTAGTFGFIVPPFVLLHLYSLMLLWGLDRSALSEVGRRRAKLALGVDLAGVAVGAWMIASMVTGE